MDDFTLVSLRDGRTASGSMSRYSPTGGYVILSGDRLFHFADCDSVVTRSEAGEVDELQRARDFLMDARRRRLFGDSPPPVQVWE